MIRATGDMVDETADCIKALSARARIGAETETKALKPSARLASFSAIQKQNVMLWTQWQENFPKILQTV
jgi:hypothetical protein